MPLSQKNNGPIYIFISYSDDDKKVAGEIKRGLEQLGFDCFLAHENISSGKWQEQIDKALETCEVFLVLLTEAAKESAWVHQECGIIHHRKNKYRTWDKVGISVIPLKKDYDPKGCMSIYQAHQLRFGWFGGLKFEANDILALSKKFVAEINGKDKSRSFALKKLTHASVEQSDLILDFALWSGITLEDTKFILQAAQRNKRMAHSDGVYQTVKLCYEHYGNELSGDPTVQKHWKDFEKLVKKRKEEEARIQQEQMEAFNKLVKHTVEDMERKKKEENSQSQSEIVEDPPPTNQAKDQRRES